MKKRLVAGLLTACAIAASAAPAFGDPDGTVSASVSVAAPCIEVTPAQLDFGTLGLSPNATSNVGASRPLTVTNCGTASENVFARGTNATSTAGTTWTLEPNLPDLCSTLNRFGQRVGTGGISVPLTTQNTAVASVAGGQASPLNALLVMPCVGSGGAGEVMTFSYLFTAVLA
jgi:hypothetical protein